MAEGSFKSIQQAPGLVPHGNMSFYEKTADSEVIAKEVPHYQVQISKTRSTS